MKVLLVFPPYTREALSDFQPVGIPCLASYILDKNPELDLRLIDFTVEKFSPERWGEELESFKPDLVGISVLTLNSPGSRILAQLTKKLAPQALVVTGGVHATAMPEECLEYSDIVVRGEGEVTLNEIIQGRELDAIKGISYRKDGKTVHNEGRELLKNLDELPLPAHHLLKMDKYRAFPGWGIMGSRGCPYDCIFCASPKMWGRTVRFRSPLSIVDEIELLHDKFGIRHIAFFDDTLNIPLQRGIEVCEEIIKRNLHKEMSFEGQIRANRPLTSPELFIKLKEANFVTIAIGIESGSEKVLKSIHKSLKIIEVRRTIKLARQAGIKEVKGFFIVGHWDETVRDIFRTWKFVLANNIQPAFSISTPFPGTSLYNLLRDQGYLQDNPDWGNFTQVTAISRTNRMSKPVIFIVYALSIVLQLIISPVRGGRPVHSFLRIVSYALDKLRIKRK